ncbi:lysophospholipid acyltransferase family protein [Phenylobacterium sp.]|uniref:lysophospholipid acyltransferase family protein n=1 Tax=Phenylobacterium sp. TaxID=1871053 RepID=UPI002BBEBD8F|nr:lysophospholipid acyltransferase family protein [Phenylobacterium sp.]HLZ73470.1 lysophospholipid acyltransferase family protein [Phenylobacterium sp.]
MTEAPTTRRQDIIWRLEERAYDVAQAFARLFPIDTVSDFGAWLFRTVGPLTSRHRTALTNLRIVFPDATSDEMARLLRAQWEETGRWIAEFPTLDRIIADPARVEVVGAERLAQIADGHPAVFISGHFSSFEIMSAVIVHSGVTCQITYRAMNNPYVDERLRESRWRYGVRLFAPKGLSGARALLRALGRGESVALMNDQKFNGGVAAPLFGVMAHTAPGPSSFALRFGIPIQPMSVQRIHKAHFRVVLHEPFLLEDTGDSEADIEAGVRRINSFIEERVLDRPEEWFWVHKRWPKEAYRKKAA